MIPTPVTASRLVEAQGANIEPFLYVLLLWGLRHHPIWFGLVFGVGFLHREFTLYAPVALLIQCLRRRTFVPAAGASYLARAAVAAGAIWLAVRVLTPAAANIDNAHDHRVFTPSSWRTFRPVWSPSRRDNLPVLFGTRSEPLAGFNITSTLAAGRSWVSWLLGAALTTMLIRLISVGLLVGRE